MPPFGLIGINSDTPIFYSNIRRNTSISIWPDILWEEPWQGILRQSIRISYIPVEIVCAEIYNYGKTKESQELE